MVKLIKKKDEAFISYLKSQSMADLHAIISLAELEVSIMPDYEETTANYWQEVADLCHIEMMDRITRIKHKPL